MRLKVNPSPMNPSPLPQLLSVSPNPFINDFSIQVQAETAEDVIITIYDKDGYPVFTSFNWLSPGINEILIGMEKHFPGIYFLKCNTYNNVFLVVIRLEKQ